MVKLTIPSIEDELVNLWFYNCVQFNSATISAVKFTFH